MSNGLCSDKFPNLMLRNLSFDSGLKDSVLDQDCLKVEDFQESLIQYGGGDNDKEVKKIWGDRYICSTSRPGSVEVDG